MKPRVAVQLLRHTGPSGLRVGVDVVRRGRLEAAIERLGAGFAATIFRAEEPATARAFAAKEALAKAIGTGVVSGVELRDIDATGDALSIHGALRLVFGRLGWRSWVRPIETEGCVGAVVWLG
jgi:hypothetical protein